MCDVRSLKGRKGNCIGMEAIKIRRQLHENNVSAYLQNIVASDPKIRGVEEGNAMIDLSNILSTTSPPKSKSAPKAIEHVYSREEFGACIICAVFSGRGGSKGKDGPCSTCLRLTLDRGYPKIRSPLAEIAQKVSGVQRHGNHVFHTRQGP